MSASREKKLRQDQTASGYVDPKAEKELEEVYDLFMESLFSDEDDQ